MFPPADAVRHDLVEIERDFMQSERELAVYSFGQRCDEQQWEPPMACLGTMRRQAPGSVSRWDEDDGL